MPDVRGRSIRLNYQGQADSPWISEEDEDHFAT